jgi:hypothetical protein
MKSLGADESAFVQTCAKYYKPVFVARLQYILKTGDYSLQDSYGETLKALNTPNVLPNTELESFGFVKPEIRKPVAEKPIVEKPVEKKKVKAKKVAKKSK